MTIVPLKDNVVIERDAADTRSAGGIWLPDTAKEKQAMGKVIAVGPGKRKDDGQRELVDVRVGDTVLFGLYSGAEFEIDGKKVLMMPADSIHGIVKK